MALARAPRVCGQPSCVGIPVFNGRCKVHAVWPTGNEARANGWQMSRLKALLIAERGERREVPGCEAAAPLELHHVNGVDDHRPEALELRCRFQKDCHFSSVAVARGSSCDVPHSAA